MLRYFKACLILVITTSSCHASFCDLINKEGIIFYDKPSNPHVTLIVGPSNQGKISYNYNYSHYDFPIKMECTNHLLSVSWPSGRMTGNVAGTDKEQIYTDLTGNMEGKSLPFYVLMTPQHEPHGGRW